MTKILITGYRHSGTTMLMQLLRSHPQVGWIEFEESYIEFDKPREWVVMMATKKVPDLKKYAWGEKIPWGNRDTDKDAKRAIDFSKKWINYFKKDARVLHILRHPIDTILSGRGAATQVKKKEFLHLVNTLEKYINFVNYSLRSSTIVYENLLFEPKKYLKKTFDFLNLNSTDKIVNKVANTDLKFGKINSDRAYAYKHKDVNIDYDYERLISTLKRQL